MLISGLEMSRTPHYFGYLCNRLRTKGTQNRSVLTRTLGHCWFCTINNSDAINIIQLVSRLDRQVFSFLLWYEHLMQILYTALFLIIATITNYSLTGPLCLIDLATYDRFLIDPVKFKHPIWGMSLRPDKCLWITSNLYVSRSTTCLCPLNS